MGKRKEITGKDNGKQKMWTTSDIDLLEGISSQK